MTYFLGYKGSKNIAMYQARPLFFKKYFITLPNKLLHYDFFTCDYFEGAPPAILNRQIETDMTQV